MQIYILTGQSNALGTTDDPSAFGSVPDRDDRDAQIAFWWSNLGPDGAPNGDSGRRISTLQVQQSLDRNNPCWWGPEFGFARSLDASAAGPFLLVKVCRGGGGNTHWSKHHRGAMYGLLVSEVTAAIATVRAAGTSPTVSALLYLQGESDSETEADVADQRLELLLANLRDDLPGAETMKLIIGGIAAEGAVRDRVRQRQSSLASRNPAVRYFDTTDLRPHLYDELHFDHAAKITVGQRFSELALDASK